MHPDHKLRARWVKMSPSLERELEGYDPGPFGKVKRIRRALHVVDAAYNRDGSLHSARLALVRDHPALRCVPKRGRFLYTKAVRLKHLMARDGWTLSADLRAAGPEWWPY